MRMKLNKSLRMGLMFATGLAAVVFAFLVYNGFYNPGFQEKKITLYGYNNKAIIDYRVFLKPNIVYSEPSMGEGQTYITPFVDYIKTRYYYEFKGDRPASIKGNYEIIGVVESYIEDKDVRKVIWRKKMVLLPETIIESQSNNVVVDETLPIKMPDFYSFANNVEQITKIRAPVRLIVTMNVNLKAVTDKGPVEQKMSPSLTIPLNAGFFEIAKSKMEDKPGAIAKTEKVRLPFNQKLVIGYGAISVIALFSLLFIIFFTSVEQDEFVSSLNNIFKKHGSRLVALNDEIPGLENSFRVKSMDDLVKIADETGKPIIYKYSSAIKGITRFGLVDTDCTYVLDLEEILPIADIETSEGNSNVTTQNSGDETNITM